MLIGIALVGQLDLAVKLAPFVGLAAGLIAYFFDRVTAVVFLVAYLLASPLIELHPMDLAVFANWDAVAQLLIFVMVNLAIITTVHRLRRALDSARRSERNHRLIAENTRDIILAYDMNRRLLYVNSAIERLLGYTVEEMQLRNFICWIHPEDEQRVLKLWDGVFSGQAHSDVEFRARTREGRELWLSGSWGPLRDEYGKQIGVQGVEREITERQLMREALAVNLSELRVAKSWAEAQAAQLAGLNEDLRVARDQALEAARTKSYFLATMSHELRTPMNGVLGMTSLLLDTGLNAEQRDLAETVQQSGESLLSIINDILDYSRMEAGKLELERADFSLRREVENVLELLAEPASRKGLELTVLIDDGVPEHVRGDAGRLRQVLVNLLGNAIKFTEHGEVWVECRAEDLSRSTAKLRFEIRDTGIGIDPESQQRIFQPFTQAEMASTRRHGGSGLGLAICKDLVEKMGGEIGIDGAAGLGSLFWFTVRLELRAQEKALVEVPAALRDARILVVDSHARTRQAIRQTLSASGYYVEEAEGLRELRLLLESDAVPFSIVIVSTNVRDGDLMAEMRRIHRTPGYLETRIVLLASRADRISRMELKENGIESVVHKPVREYLLRRVLEAGMVKPEAAPSRKNFGHNTGQHTRGGKHAPKVLIAEDNALNRRLAVRLMEKMGFDADCVNNGVEATEAMERGRYDAVLMDCHMPEMDGLEATRSIRRTEGGARRTPIIAMTANVFHGERERCLAAGMDDYLTKPVDARVLAETLHRWIARGTLTTTGVAGA